MKISTSFLIDKKEGLYSFFAICNCNTTLSVYDVPYSENVLIDGALVHTCATCGLTYTFKVE